MTVTGVIRTVNLQRGFFFVSGSAGDVFCHFSKLSPEMAFDERLEGQTLTCSTESAEKGLRATAVWPAEGGRR